MSVPKPMRNQSEMEFIRNARELQIYTIRKCKKFPTRFTFYVSVPLANSSMRVYENVKRGNSVNPSNQHEAQIRRDYFVRAIAELNSLVSQVEIAAEMFGVAPEVMREWMRMVNREIELIKGVMNADRRRYKSLPE